MAVGVPALRVVHPVPVKIVHNGFYPSIKFPSIVSGARGAHSRLLKQSTSFTSTRL